MMAVPVTKDHFESLSPFMRGWAVYMAGSRRDQPNIPNETNPYPEDTSDHNEWNRGQQRAVIECIDSEE